jgi:hypothetical protein
MSRQDERKTFQYMGLLVIADYFKGKYQGVIRAQFGKKVIFSAEGTSVDDVVTKLLHHIDTDETMRSRYHRKQLTHKELIINAFHHQQDFKGTASLENRIVFKVDGGENIDAIVNQLKTLIDDNPKVIETARTFDGRHNGAFIESYYKAGSFKATVSLNQKILHEHEDFKDVQSATKYAKAWVDDNESLILSLISEAHRNHLERYNVGSIGVNNLVKTSKSRRRRVSHCWRCKQTVDNQFQYECVLCGGWIICSCGACGCGYATA